MRTRKRNCQGLLTIVALLTLLTTDSNDLWSQSGRGVGWDTGTVNAPPMLRLWNWPDTLFLIGAYGNPSLPTGVTADIWPFMDSMGLSLLASSYYGNWTGQDSINALNYFDKLAWSANVSKGHRITQWDATLYGSQIGQARAVEFYPFDSAQSPWYPFRFMSTDDTVYGEVDYNSQGIPNDTLSRREHIYDVSNTSPGTVIAEHIVFNGWDDELLRTARWPSQTASGTVHEAYIVDRWIQDDRPVDDDGLPGGPQIDSLYYLVITGHLFENGTSLDSDSLLKVEVIYEVPKYDAAKDVKLLFHPGANTTTAQSPSDTTFPITTFFVTKSALKPQGNDIYNKYQEAIFPLDMRYLANGAWGPTNPGSANNGELSRRFDLKVTWLGGEQLALRSVTLRSLHGQLVFGKDSASRAWRQGRINR
ncbi:MAG: hypothetical protein AB7H80_06580 [Candidatus Kapaibacterium sp.]